MRRTYYHNSHEDHGHQNQERWLLTYADMITLLTAFFLMLYSMSVMSRGKFSAIATSVRGGFHGVLTENNGSGIAPDRAGAGGPGQNARAYLSTQNAIAEMRKYVEQQGKSAQINVHGSERGITISLLSDGMLFEQGSASLRSASRPLLEHVARILRTVPNGVQVEGHTDSLPIHTAQFPSNWELSTARAGAVLRAFTEQSGADANPAADTAAETGAQSGTNAATNAEVNAGTNALEAKRFTCAGYADTRPVAGSDSDAHRAQNRRVDIILLKTDAQREGDALRRQELRRILQNPLSQNESAEPATADAGAGSGTGRVPPN